MNAIEMLFLIVILFASLIIGHVSQKYYGTAGFIGGFLLGFIACFAVYRLVYWIIGQRTKK
jgi:hypothetical protein